MKYLIPLLLFFNLSYACDIDEEVIDLADSYVVLYETNMIGGTQYEQMIQSIFTLDAFHQTNLEFDDALLTSLSVEFMCDSLENARLGVEMIKYLHLLDTSQQL